MKITDVFELIDIINHCVWQVNRIDINTVDGEMIVSMHMTDEKHSDITVSFIGTTSLSIQYSMTPPITIHGFEIIDNKNNGWERSQRYYVHDYEDGIISFYCRDIIPDNK